MHRIHAELHCERHGRVRGQQGHALFDGWWSLVVGGTSVREASDFWRLHPLHVTVD
jgi:hypothetical protein